MKSMTMAVLGAALSLTSTASAIHPESTTIDTAWSPGTTGLVASATIEVDTTVVQISRMALDLSHTALGDLDVIVTAPGGYQFILMMDESDSGALGLAGTGFLDDVDTYTFFPSGAGGGPNGNGTFGRGLNVGGDYNAEQWSEGATGRPGCCFGPGTWLIEIYDDAFGNGGAVGDWSFKWVVLPAPGGIALIGIAGVLAGRRPRRRRGQMSRGS